MQGQSSDGAALAGPFGRGKAAIRWASRLARATRAAETLLDGEAEALTRKAVEMALAGDTTALRLCLDQILSPRKGRPVTLDLPAVTDAAKVQTALTRIVTAASEGEITPDEAGALTVIIEAQRRAIETVELEARLRAVEERSR